jgi:hypothetical protein
LLADDVSDMYFVKKTIETATVSIVKMKGLAPQSQPKP